ncbi:MAG: ribose 1,5-bisphosphate isomerase [Thermoproteota archaeon]|jgi:ribose 1,5-bisphosphate isomerase
MTDSDPINIPTVSGVVDIDVDTAYTQIKDMRIHGAGRIARLAASALKNYVENTNNSDREQFYNDIMKNGAKLRSARPTAVSLPNGVNIVLASTKKSYNAGDSADNIKEATIKAAEQFVHDSLDAYNKIGEYGGKRIRNGDTVITICNSEAAISVLKAAHDMGKGIKIICCETRPLFQGHKTAATLSKHGCDVTIIIDSAARRFVEKADRAVCGADAVAVNGAVVNKIGTSQLAAVAHEARVKLMAAAETYKFYAGTMYGELTEIEERDATEVCSEEYLKAYPNIKIRNPVFDVTPPENIDVIITEKGIIPPSGASTIIKELIQLM